MYSPTTRLLTVLEILQSQGGISGPELAKRLEVDVRSVRRYVTMMRDMGIPVESDAGRYGTYYLRPGFRLPPLMFTGAEIIAIILGLVAVRHLGLSRALAVDSAAAKIQRVLPDELREQARALQEVLTLNIPTSHTSSEDLIAKVSLAAYQHNQAWIEYHGGENSRTARIIDVYGLVYHGLFWYAVGYCHLREDIRIFRLDRVQQIKLLDIEFEPPQDFDALGYLLTKIANMPMMWLVEVVLKTTLKNAQSRVSRAMGVLEEVEDGVLLRLGADNLEWAAHFLVGLHCPMVILHPPELRDELRKVAQSILEIADSPA
jgi:predicted DNA-binding transcriptional regulator YafY